MKNNKTKRIFALLAAVIIIIILVFLVISFYGNPLTHKRMRKEADNYMKKHFPAITYEITETRYIPKTNSYRISVLDKDHNHEFTILYHMKSEELDDTYFWEICNFIDGKYASIAEMMEQDVQKALPEKDAPLTLSIDCDSKNMQLDMEFHPEQSDVPVTLSYQSKEKETTVVTMDELKKVLKVLQPLPDKYHVHVDTISVYDIEVPINKIQDDAYLQKVLDERNASVKDLNP